MILRHHRAALLVFVVHYFARCLAQTQRNITVDDNDPSIVYGPNWGSSQPSRFDAGGSHHLTEDPNTSATFTFIGVAIYFMSPRWPYDVYTQLQLDSQPPVELTLIDPNQANPTAQGEETVMSTVVWGSGTLPNGTHTLVIRKIPRPDRPYAVVDSLIYTVVDTPPPTSSSSSTSSTTSPSSLSSSKTSNAASPTNTSSNDNDSSSNSSHVLPIALGTVLGALGLFIIAIALWFCCRGRKRPKSEAWTVAGASLQTTSPPSGPLSPKQPAAQTMYTGYPSQQPYGANPSASASWSGSSPQMSTVSGVPLMANAQPHAYSNQQPQTYSNHKQPSQDFNPWSGFTQAQQQQQQPNPYLQHQSSFQQAPFYAPTTLSTITERSTPGTMNSNRLPLGASPASYPSADLSYYTPPQGYHGSDVRLSYASEQSASASPANPQQHSYASGSMGQPRSPQSSTNFGGTVLPGREKGSMMVANRTEEPEGSGPPAYTL
ncbi:hypothetical protein AN958_11889 [Leucoagaricus sp. SymC.cos]|nr:hypothetical protein AN958_11889 [Leucoagaricus sp. SymC.cos]